jgi:RimJ/RimL family protein N-acetyltransferase
MWADPLVVRYIGGKPFAPEETWARLLRYTGHWALLGFGYWIVEEKVSGEFAGEAGFAHNKRDLGESSLLSGVPEIGWAFVARVHGRGYATEVVRAITAWGDAHLEAARTGCIIDPENRASIRVAEKYGYAQRQRVLYKGHEVLVFVR